MHLSRPLPRNDLEFIAEVTRLLWDEVRGQHLFITGGTGFFGCWIVESFCFINHLLALNARATILTRNPDEFKQRCPHLASDTAIVLHKGDIRDFIFPEEEYRYVIHAATESSSRQSVALPHQMLSTIVEGTERALQFASAHGTRKFLLTSSGAVYGKQPAGLSQVPETYSGGPDPLDPGSVYGEGKRTAELLCALYQRPGKLDCKIARCWAFCGPHLPLDRHFAIGNFIGDALGGRPIQIKGDGTPRRSYLYAADLTVWLWTILFRAPSLMAINVGSDRDVSIVELARTVASVLRPQTDIQIAQRPPGGTPPLRYVPCVARAAELLDLRQTIGLEETIRKTADWYAQ